MVFMFGDRASKCSYMNDAKWTQVLEVIVANGFEPRIKTIYHDVVDSMQPYGAICHRDCDPAYHLDSTRVWRVTNTYWDSKHGPFRTQSIEWLALNEFDFDRIASQLPPNLMLVREGGRVVIKGYEF